MSAARRVAGGMVLLAAFALMGCDDARFRPEPSATALPEGISATLVSSAEPDQALVRIANTTDELFEIGWLRVDDPRFARATWSRARKDQVVPARTTSLLRVFLPGVRCNATARDGTRVTVQFAFGASIAVASAPLDDPDGVVAALAADRCG